MQEVGEKSSNIIHIYKRKTKLFGHKYLIGPESFICNIFEGAISGKRSKGYQELHLLNIWSSWWMSPSAHRSPLKSLVNNKHMAITTSYCLQIMMKDQMRFFLFVNDNIYLNDCDNGSLLKLKWNTSLPLCWTWGFQQGSKIPKKGGDGNLIKI